MKKILLYGLAWFVPAFILASYFGFLGGGIGNGIFIFFAIVFQTAFLSQTSTQSDFTKQKDEIEDRDQ